MIDNVEATLLPKRISVNFVGGLCQEIEPCLNMLEAVLGMHAFAEVPVFKVFSIVKPD